MSVPIGAISIHRGRSAAWSVIASTLLSGLGNAVVAVAVPWLVLERTGSAALAGTVAAASFGPLVVSALLGGALVDRWGRRASSIGADVLSAVAVAALPLLDAVSTLDVVPVMALVALGAVFDGPGAAARESLRPDVAVRAGWSLAKVNARGEAAEAIAGLVGPGVAGVLVVAVGPMPTLWLTAALLLAAAVVTAVGVAGPAPVRGASRPAREPYLAAVRAGLELVWRDPAIRACGVLGMMLVAVHVPLTSVLLPAHLQVSGRADALGLVLSAGAAGSLSGALATGWLLRHLSRRSVLVLGVAGSTAALGALAVLPGATATAAVVGVCGLFTGPLTPVVSVIVQERTPEPLRARVIGTTTSLFLAATPVGLLAAGALAEIAGLTVAFAAAAVASLTGGVYAVAARVAS